MYRANRPIKVNIVPEKSLIIIIFIAITALAIFSYFILRSQTSSSSHFTRQGVTVAEVRPEMKVLTTDYFKITLPVSWAFIGRKNPKSNEVYYEFQNQLKDYDNRWLKVYVDVIPYDLPINKVMPIEVVNNKIIPGLLSDDCHNFEGVSKNIGVYSWRAKWQDVEFICDVEKKLQNNVGTVSKSEGYAVAIMGSNNVKHKYFFLYTDHNVRPDYSVFTDALKNFEPI